VLLLKDKRLYNEPSDSPSFVLKTSLDPKSPLEENPYVKANEEEAKKEELQEFFDDGSV